MLEVACPFCGAIAALAELRANDMFCSVCGQQLIESDVDRSRDLSLCVYCNRKISEEDGIIGYCPHCFYAVSSKKKQ